MIAPTNAEVIHKYTDYGFMKGELNEQEKMVMILTRNKKDPKKPHHELLTFPQSVEPDSSKLYIYNAVWNAETQGRGKV